MNVLITGGSGLIGRALCRELLKRGDRVTVLSRRGERARVLCGRDARIISSLDEWKSDETFDSVVNLAGEPIVGRRWSARRKRQLHASRVTLTQHLVSRMVGADRTPPVLLSASAVGYYGDTGEAEVTETGAGATPDAAVDFGARLCSEWEEAARQAESAGVRVCLLRTGLVLSREGGMLMRMYPAFCLGLGMSIGDGRQWMSWIHMTDQINAMLHLLDNPQSQGAYNLTAPSPVTNVGFTQALARQLRRPAVFSMPAFALNLLLGEAAQLLLGGQKAIPQKLQGEKFQFAWPDLTGALRELFQ